MKHVIVIVGIVSALVQLAYSCRCIPPTPGEEVCGSDGKTYGSSCLLFCTAWAHPKKCLEEIHEGPCKKKPCVCKGKPKPVCGSDGKTYCNFCILKCMQKYKPCLRKIKNGACGECKCSSKKNRVCGSDCITYTNPCEFKCRQEVDLYLFKLYNGTCKKNCQPVPIPKCNCSNKCKPVCGSNGRTYDNECWLKCAQQYEPNLKKVKNGICDKKSKGLSSDSSNSSSSKSSDSEDK